MFKKGQMEMIGLVIVVILLVIGFLFYVKFGILRKEDKTSNLVVENAYTTNLMSAILNIKVCEDSPVKIEQAIVSCFNNNQICGEEACNYVKESIKTVMSDIGPKNYKKYSVWIVRGNENRTISDECRTGILTQTTIVTANRDHYTTYFRVC